MRAATSGGTNRNATMYGVLSSGTAISWSAAKTPEVPDSTHVSVSSTPYGRPSSAALRAISATATRLTSRKPARAYASAGDMCATSRPNRTMPL